VAVLALSIVPAGAQEEEAAKTGWLDEAELSLVATDGNSQSETFSLRNSLTRTWDGGAEFEILAGGLRAESTASSRSAVGSSAADALLVESSTTTVTAERYYLEMRYDQPISERWYWYAAGGWDRNEPAGIRNRTAIRAGVGNIWFDRQGARWRTDYGLSQTEQEDVVDLPGSASGFLGLRLSSDYARQLTETTEFTNLLTVDQNLDRGEDLRATMVNTLSVRMSDSLALKLSHELQFDNEPSLIAVPVVTAAGVPIREDLLVEADDLDTTLSLALVVGF
jgi:putative salt-induced outer membrane protein YdiY